MQNYSDDDVFEEDEEDDEDFDDFEFYEDQFRDLIYTIGNEEGYFNDDEEKTDYIVEQIVSDYFDYVLKMVDEYGNIDEALEDEDLREYVIDALNKKDVAVTSTKNDHSYKRKEKSEKTVKEDINDGDSIEMFINDDPKYSRRSFVDDRYTVMFDSKGSKIGYKRRNMLMNDITNYYDETLGIKGYSRRSLINKDRTNYYDTKGKMIGYSRISFINDDYINYYDVNGNRLGNSRKDLLNGDYQKYFKKKKKK